MVEVIDASIDSLRNEKSIWLYGIGKAGKKVSAFFDAAAIPVKGILVSDTADNPTYYNGVKIYPVAQCPFDQDSLVILTVHKDVVPQVIRSLENSGYGRYLVWNEKALKGFWKSWPHRFIDRRREKNKVLFILSGYKQFLWEYIFDRVKRFTPNDTEVCICSSGLFDDRLDTLAQQNDWSYLSTEKNSVSIIQNVAYSIYGDCKWFYKMDEDIFLTEDSLVTLYNGYEKAEKTMSYHIGVMAPLIPLNEYGYYFILQKYGCFKDYENRYGKAYFGSAALVNTPDIALYMWGKYGSIPFIDKMTKDFSIERFSVCAIRYNIGLILFQREFWEEMNGFPVTGGRDMGADEEEICAFCSVHSKAVVVAHNVVVGHFAFGKQETAMKRYLNDSPDKFSLGIGGGELRMKLCRRTIEYVQVVNEDGAVRLCSWLKDGGIIGKLTDNTMEEIYHSTEAELIREYHLNKDYSNCNPNACPYVANNNVEENFIELDEVPRFPPSLYLAYENVCNYHCVMCTIPDCMKRADAVEWEKKLNKIDAEVRKVLPYVKHISANGLGELFTSKHILKLLSEWKPVADPAECSVGLETNGSLFNEKNWNQISNLGQYHLSVAITVLSFEEDIYQELSGTTLPVSNLVDNLHFVKSLREKGIINYFELATVYQEKNFRQLPEFARRCIEEFSADYVRLRPYEPWREVDMQEWFKDVRNEYHPYHKEFLEVMKDPVFKHPKVHDWGGGQPSGLGPEPYIKTRARYHLMEGIFCDADFEQKIDNEIKTEQIVVYGMAVVGRALASALRNRFEIPFCIDRAMNGQSFAGIPIYDANHLKGLGRNMTVIVSLEKNEEAIISLLNKEGFEKVISIKELVGSCNEK